MHINSIKSVRNKLFRLVILVVVCSLSIKLIWNSSSFRINQKAEKDYQASMLQLISKYPIIIHQEILSTIPKEAKEQYVLPKITKILANENEEQNKDRYIIKYEVSSKLKSIIGSKKSAESSVKKGKKIIKIIIDVDPVQE